jgi:hypothetical protein
MAHAKRDSPISLDLKKMFRRIALYLVKTSISIQSSYIVFTEYRRLKLVKAGLF